MKYINVVGVNVSNSFPSRCRCKGCGRKPDITNANVSFRKIRAFYKRLARNLSKPFCTTISYDYTFSYWKRKVYKYGINPQFHKNHRYDNRISASANFTDYVVCPCGKTTWAFRGYDDKIESTHRRANYDYC